METRGMEGMVECTKRKWESEGGNLTTDRTKKVGIPGGLDAGGLAIPHRVLDEDDDGSNYEDASDPNKPRGGGGGDNDEEGSNCSGPDSKVIVAEGFPPLGNIVFEQLAGEKRQVNDDVVGSIKSFAESILKLEQAKMEMYKDTERLRMEAESRRAELELKRTEMIMTTQLQIAKLLSAGNSHKKKKPRKSAKKAKTAGFEPGNTSTENVEQQTPPVAGQSPKCTHDTD